MSTLAKDRLIVALDVDSPGRARELFSALSGIAGMFKIGPQLFVAAGPAIVREIVSAGGRVFLDLKFHDIPTTVAAAGVEAARLGVSIFNVHASGGAEMMRRTAAAVSAVSEREGLKRPRIIAVTVLTSIDAKTLPAVGVAANPDEQVTRLALLAEASGLEGAVVSPLEIAAVRNAIKDRNFIIVTPGVRPLNTDSDDQKRIATPAQAVRDGADYVVIGRPIIAAPDPVDAARKIIEEMVVAAPFHS
jgi:orotidine-5'-phosphate decarboxylase